MSRGVLWVIVAILTATPVSAQVRIRLPQPIVGGKAGSASASGESRIVHVTDRRLAQRLFRARELLAGGDREGTITLIQSLLDHPEDCFFREESGPFRSLKGAAAGLLDRLDAAGLRLYELRFGASAARLLNEARAAGGAARLEEVTRRFGHTVAGRQAILALGNLHFDRGRPLAAAHWFDQLHSDEPMLSLKIALCWRHAGQPQRAREVLESLRRKHGGQPLRLGGRAVRLFTDSDQALAWLDDVAGSLVSLSESVAGSWWMRGGDPARNASSSNTSPAWDGEWSLVTFERELDDAVRQSRLAEALVDLERLARLEGDQDSSALPASAPLVVGDVLIVRSLFDVKAVHLPTGRHLWDTVTIDATFESILEGKLSTAANVPNLPGRVGGRVSLRENYLRQRAWWDRTAGTLSSDGRLVFAVDEVGVVGYSAGNRPSTTLPREYNRLLAFELASEGKLVWELGGPPGEFQLDLGGTFFLGPPLPLDGRLLCLGELDGEVRLSMLVVEPGRPDGPVRVEWSQAIAEPEFDVQVHPTRRLAGLSPSFADGVLVCPTEAGLVVGIDLARRQLLWSYAYRSSHSLQTTDPNQARRFRMMVARGMVPPPTAEDTWYDATPVIAGGRVLITPRDSNELHCIRLRDGRRMWSRPRGQGRFLAGVFDGRVIVVEGSQVQAWRLEDGQPAWDRPVAIPKPSGTGIRVGRRYLLPASPDSPATGRPGAVVTIDLETGRLLARSPSRSGRVHGNLVAAGDRLISQSVSQLGSFRPAGRLEKQVAESLARQADDPAALALRGELRLQAGQIDQGLEDLQASYRGRPDPRVRDLVVTALLEGLRNDFDRFIDRADQVEPLLSSAVEMATFRRIKADGLARSGRSGEALIEYLKLAGTEGRRAQLERIDGSLRTRSDRWARARLAELYSEANAGDRAAVDREIRSRLDRAKARPGPDPIRWFLDYFDRGPVADEARRVLVERLPADRLSIEREQLLVRLGAVADLREAGIATARLARMWIDGGRASAAAPLVAELDDRFADVKLIDDRPGRELARAWRAEPGTADALAPGLPWRRGKVETFERQVPARGTSAISYPILFRGPVGPALAGWSLRLDQRRQFVVAYDSGGREQWKLSTVGDLSVEDSKVSVPYSYGNFARANGHLLLIVLGNRFAMIDTLVNEHPKVLWKRNLFEESSGPNVRVFRFTVGKAGGRARFRITDAVGRSMGGVGPLSPELVTCQVGTRLYGLDPLTGHTLWVRGGFRRGCRLEDNDRFVFVHQESAKQVTVLRATDGAYIETRSLPENAEPIIAVDRFVVTRAPGIGEQRIDCLDLVSGKTAWSLTVAGELEPQVVGDRAVAFYEPSGRFRVVGIADGTTLLDARLKPSPVAGFGVIRSPGRLVLLLNRREGAARVLPYGSNAMKVNGAAIGFDTGTASRAWGPVAIENQAIDLDQPRDLPLLIFTCRLYRPVQNIVNPRPRNEYAVLVLDQRDGRVVHRQVGTLPISSMRVRPDRRNQKITVDFYRSSIELKFTGEPPDAK